jgi:hypothetical protein
MGIPSIVTFEVEAIELDSKYERKQAMKRLEKFRQLSRNKSLKVAKLPSLGPSNVGITDAMWGGRAPNNRMSLPCLSIMDDKGVPNQKHQTNDFGKDMKMSCT